jgi:Domain of unknown function (DUF4382)/Domain of unknown function (DUF5666)
VKFTKPRWSARAVRAAPAARIVGVFRQHSFRAFFPGVNAYCAVALLHIRKCGKHTKIVMVKSTEKFQMRATMFGLSSLAMTSALLAACGGGSSGSSGLGSPAAQTGTVSMLVSDASTEDWATIGVQLLSISLVPQGGGSNVVVYTAPTPAPTVNLAELDQIAEILGNVPVATGTYTGAVLTVSGNSGDVSLVVAADPEAGFVAMPGTTIPAAQIQIQHTQGTSPNLNVPIDVNFVSPLVVSANQNNALDLEFELGHPAFIVGHTPPSAGGTTLWAVNFDGPVRHHPLHDLTRLVLRHLYGDVTAVAADNTGVTLSKEFPVYPVTNPETAVSSTQSLTILADATNGTLFYDVDAKTHTVIKDFSSVTGLVGKSVRVAARYQENGTLTATRIWASSTFSDVWLSPEGHVLHVDTANNIVAIANESGQAVDLVVDANTQFFFREPQNALADSTPIGTGPAFLSNQDLVRGFKVHASVVDPLATPLVAQTIDIEVAKYDGTISAANSTDFIYTRKFRTVGDDYQHVLNYISGSTANGTDVSGNAVTGYAFWNFAYPTVLDSGSNSITDFVSATSGSVNFGGTVGAVPSRGVSFAVWNDPAMSNGWSAADSILTPALLPLGFVSAGYASNSFMMTVLGGTSAATIDVSTTGGSATLVYQIDRTGGMVTVSPIDITTSLGLSSLTAGLAVGAPVRLYGIPQADGTLKAYVLAYFTGTMPAQ